MPAFPEGWDDPTRFRKRVGMGDDWKGEDEMQGVKANKPSNEVLQALWVKHAYQVNPIAKELQTSWMNARKWLIEAGIINTLENITQQAPPQTQETNATSEPEPGTPEPAKESVPCEHNVTVVAGPITTCADCGQILRGPVEEPEDTQDARAKALEDLRYAEAFDEVAQGNPEKAVNLVMGDLPKEAYKPEDAGEDTGHEEPQSKYNPSDNDYNEEEKLPFRPTGRLIETPANGTIGEYESMARKNRIANKAKLGMIRNITCPDLYDKVPGDIPDQERLDIIASLLGWRVPA